MRAAFVGLPVALSLALSLVAALATSARADDWVQFAGGADRTGRVGETVSPGTGPAWAQALGGNFRAGPVVADGVVVVVDREGNARGLDAASGSQLWAQALGGRGQTSTPAVGRGRVVVSLGDGRVVCLSIASGHTLWAVAGGGGPRAAVGLEGDTVIVSQGYPSRKLRAYDLISGALRWEQNLSQVAYSSPALGGGRVVVGLNDGRYETRDLTTGALVWAFPTSGSVLLAAPTLAGNHVYLLPGGTDARLYRVHSDQAQWGTNWTLALNDPAVPGPGWANMGVKRATSTPAWTGQFVVCLVRFDYTRDTVAPWWVPDQYISRERIYVIDPAGPSIVWQADVAAQTVSKQQDVPPFGLCPSPLVISDGATTWVGVASSINASFRYYRVTNGAAAGNFALAGKRWGRAASPALANTRLALVTSDGALEVRSLGGNVAPSAPTNGVAGGTVFDGVAQPTLTWSAAADADDAAATISYEVRIDDDGEVLLDADLSALVAAGTTSWQVPSPLTSDATYSFSVRARDPKGAYSPWSTSTSLQVALTPLPPKNLLASAEPTSIELTWIASPSAGVDTYVVSWREKGGSFTQGVEVGSGTRHTVSGLKQGTLYEFRVWARTSLNKNSTFVALFAAPQPRVLLNGVPMRDLLSAILNAKKGSLVQLAAGTYRVRGTIHLARGVLLRGVGRLTRIAGDPLFPVFQVGAPGNIFKSKSKSSEDPAIIRLLSIHGGLVGVEVHSAVLLDHVLIYDVEDAVHAALSSEVEGRYVTLTRAKKRGLVADTASSVTLSNAIVSANDVGLECTGTAAKIATRFSAIAGNTTADRVACEPSETDPVALPAFLNVDLRDFRVASTSPTVDAGDPEIAVQGEPVPHGGRVNLGAFGNTFEAATSPEATTPTSPAPAGRRSSGGCALGAGNPSGGAPLWALVLALGLLRLRNPRAPVISGHR